MRKNSASFLALLCSLLILPAVFAKEGASIVSINYLLMSQNPARAIEALRKYTRERDGYVKFFSDNKIILRIPADAASAVKGMLRISRFFVLSVC